MPVRPQRGHLKTLSTTQHGTKAKLLKTELLGAAVIYLPGRLGRLGPVADSWQGKTREACPPQLSCSKGSPPPPSLIGPLVLIQLRVVV